MNVEISAIIASLATAVVLKVVARAIDWYFPRGHHSKRVSRYGTRDDHPAEEDTTDD